MREAHQGVQFVTASSESGAETPNMDVAFVHDSRRFDGMFECVKQAVTSLDGTPCRVRVFTCIDPSLEEEYPRLGTIVRGYRVPLGGDVERGVNRWTSVFARRLAHLRADIVHLWSVSLAAMVRRRSRVLIAMPDVAKYTTHLYGRIPSYLHNRMLKYVPYASGVTCLTEWARRDIVASLGISESRVTVVPPWTVTDPSREATGAPFAPPTQRDPWTLLAVGVDRPHKNLRLFLEVLARLDNRYRGVLVTRPTATTRAVVERLGVASRVRFAFGLEDLTTEFQRAQLLLHPSIYEGFGLPLLEAMAHGLPVLATNRTCIPEVVGDGGVLLEPGEVAPWVTAVESLSEEDRYRRTSRRALERAAEFPRARSRRALLSLYARVREGS